MDTSFALQVYLIIVYYYRQFIGVSIMIMYVFLYLSLFMLHNKMNIITLKIFVF